MKPAQVKSGQTKPLAHMSEDGSRSCWQFRFWSIFGGQAICLVGSSLAQFVLLWWITNTTGSMTALLAAGMATLLPQALLSPLGGALADRYSRRGLMITADAVSALCMVVLIMLFLTERIELWHAYTMMAVRSATQAFQAPAASASVAMLVPHSFVGRVARLNQSLQSSTLVAVAPLGALAIGAMPIGWVLSIDVFTALLGIVPLLCFRIPQPAERHMHEMGLWGDFREGLHLVSHMPGLRQLFMLLAMVALAVMPTIVLVPFVIKMHCDGCASASRVAQMEVLAGGAMLLGCMLMAAAMDPRRLVHWTIVGFAVSCATIALSAIGPASLLGVAMAWWAMSGIRLALGDASLTALLYATIPHQFQGRVLALVMTIVALAAPVGVALALPLGEWVGVRGVFVVAGAASALVSLVGILSPDLLAPNGQPNMHVDARK